MSTVTQLYGRSTFAFHRIIRSAKQYLEKTNNRSQISFLPATYPQQQNSLDKVDISVRAKILKSHLEDTYKKNNFSVSITRRKENCTITVHHDLTSSDEIAEIIQIYQNDTTKIILDTFVSDTCE